MNREDTFITFEKLFWQLSRKMRHLWNNVYETTFPGSQAHIMFLLQQHGPQKMSEIAHALHLTAGAVTSASDHLIAHQCITRTRDRIDRRVVRLALTDKGAETLLALQDEGRKIIQQVFHGIADESLEMMTDLFLKGNDNIDQIDE